MKRRARVIVSGRVQGVFFRDSTRREATRAGLTGWVCNLPEGRVEALFEGDEAAVQRLVEWCRRGPPDAHVEQVAVEWGEVTGEFDRFTTERTPREGRGA